MFLSFAVSYSILVIISFFFLGGICENRKQGLPLNDYIHHFEPLFYDHRHLQEVHRRSDMEQHFTLQFSAHNRVFRLRLKRDPLVFAEDIQFENTCTKLPYDTSRALTGYLEDEDKSSIEAVVTKSGFLDGVVKLGEEEFYIEPAKNYLKSPHDFHSVIYKLSDVRFSPHNLTCLSHLIQPHLNRANELFRKPKQKSSVESINHCCSFQKSLDESLVFKRSIKLSQSSEEHHLHQHRKRSHLTDESIVQSKPKTTNSNSKHFELSWPSKSNDRKHRYRTHKTTKHLASSTVNLRDDLKFQQNITNLILYNHTLNKAAIKFFNLNVASNYVNGGSKYGAPYSKNVAKSRRQRTRLRNFMDFSNSVVNKNSNSDDDSHEDHGGSYSNFSGDTVLKKREYFNESVPDLDAREPPKYGIKINPKKRGEMDPPFKSKGAFKTSDLPYWRELDALHYTEDGRTGSSEPYGVRSIQRTQWTEDRGQRHVAVDRRKSTCLLYLQADHLFYQKMGSEEACIEAMTRHVQRVNSIYRSTDFDQDGRPDNISFLIKRIKVHTSPDHNDYRFVGSYGVEKFLELFSEDDYDAFCLAYMFTYRDFEGGTLGLAWTGDLKNAGGVCEKNGHYRGSLKSLNTGIITLLNYGKHVPPVVSHVTLAHEIGHNFGSPHDPEDDQHCTPGGDHGNYIMFARATSGDKRNNNKFSPCSLRSINAVLNTKARSVKGCFTEPLDAVCGNEVVEGAEECDCGWEEDCHEPCCFPMRVNPPQDQPPCRLRPAAFCSPSQGPCCSHDCRLKYGVMCREDNGCRSASYCDGKGPQCPSSTKKPNKTVCSEEFVCYNGECTGSICMAYGLESCQCLRTIHDPIIRSCELCCKLPGDELSCKSSFEWNSSPYDVPDLYAKPGAPCDNYNGYCDVHQSCREIDPSGPLATLRKLLLSPEGAVILRRWLSEKWWGILLLFLAVTVTVVLSARLLTRGPTKSFLSTILPHQSDFRFCHGRSSTRSRPTYLVTNSSKKTRCVSRPRVSSAPENGWV